ncbi:virion morphogenesis protein [Bacteriophage sp.]|nr:virion morphogenesis protein [Bacteriophage sp.]
MLRISFEIEGSTEFDRTFTRFAENLRDMRQLWPGVITELGLITEEQFKGEGIGRSGRWANLSPAYARWKAKHYPGKPILQRTSRLYRSLTQRNNADNVVDARPDELVFGSKVPYGVYHQRGGGRLKRRPVFDLNERQKTRLLKAIQVRLLKAGRDNGVTVS